MSLSGALLWSKIGSLFLRHNHHLHLAPHDSHGTTTSTTFLQHKLYQSFFFLAWLVLYQIGVCYSYPCWVGTPPLLKEQQQRHDDQRAVQQVNNLVSESDDDSDDETDHNKCLDNTSDIPKAVVIDRYTIRRVTKTVPIKRGSLSSSSFFSKSSSSKHSCRRSHQKKTIVVYRREEIDLPVMLLRDSQRSSGSSSKRRMKRRHTTSRDYYTLVGGTTSGNGLADSLACVEDKTNHVSIQVDSDGDTEMRSKECARDVVCKSKCDGAENQVNVVASTNPTMETKALSPADNDHQMTTAEDSSPGPKLTLIQDAPRKKKNGAPHVGLRIRHESKKRIRRSSSHHHHATPTWFQTLPSISENA